MAVDDDDKNCPICFEDIEERLWVHLYTCTHRLHFDCLSNWFFNQCETMSKATRDNPIVHPRIMTPMECLGNSTRCPTCRDVWKPDAKTVEPPNKGHPNQTTNKDLYIQVVKQLEAAKQKIDQANASSSARVYVDEATDMCPHCNMLLSRSPWARLSPCSHPFHVGCAVEFLTNAILRRHENEEPPIPCPTCNVDITLIDPWKWATDLGYLVRPVPPEKYLAERRPRHPGTVETKEKVIFAELWANFTNNRDREVEKLYLEVPSSATQVVSAHRDAVNNDADLGFEEYQGICHICRKVLAVNWWVEVECGHRFHLGCLTAKLQSQKNELTGLECPVCLFTIACSRSRMPRGIVWATKNPELNIDFPFITTKGGRQVHEAVLWWVYDFITFQENVTRRIAMQRNAMQRRSQLVESSSSSEDYPTMRLIRASEAMDRFMARELRDSNEDTTDEDEDWH